MQKLLKFIDYQPHASYFGVITLNSDISNPIICAIDTKDTDEAISLCKKIEPYVGMIKLGLEFFTANGPEGVREITKLGIPVFLDLKYHDIPNTVAEAVRAAVNLGVDVITIHTLGGRDMMQHAVAAAYTEADRTGNKRPLIFGVTVLTSMDKTDLNMIGIRRTPANQVALLANLANKCNLDGVVCSPHEIKLVKSVCDSDFKTIVPGIRPKKSDSEDQKRVMTPGEALRSGADYIVIGRPITKEKDPSEAAKNIYLQLLN